MCLKDFECSCGNRITKDVPMTAEKQQQHSQIEWCAKCQRTKIFQRVYSPVAVAFGMLAGKPGFRKQAAAVNGWGTYTTDYGKAGSDLVTGRAQEAARNIKPAVVD